MLISFLTHLSLSIGDSNKKRDPLWGVMNKKVIEKKSVVF